MLRMLYVISEGRTECAFIKHVLAEHLLAFGWIAQPITLITGRNTAGVRKGGWRRTGGYGHAVKETWRAIATHKNAVHTTFFDLYGFPTDAPCYEKAKTVTSPQEKARLYENQLKKDVAYMFAEDASYRGDLFIPYVQPYEFECFFFIDPERSAAELSYGNAVIARKIDTELANTARDFETPEHINNDPDTAPSKRLEKLVPGFVKNKAGKSGLSWKIAQEIGVQRIRQSCQHFDDWLTTIESYK